MNAESSVPRVVIDCENCGHPSSVHLVHDKTVVCLATSGVCECSCFMWSKPDANTKTDTTGGLNAEQVFNFLQWLEEHQGIQLCAETWEWDESAPIENGEHEVLAGIHYDQARVAEWLKVWEEMPKS